MAFALCLDYVDEKRYIHKLYSSERNNTSPKTTTNMNFALLFDVESKAIHWREKNGIPIEFNVVFIPLSVPLPSSEEKANTTKKRYYNVLKSGGKSFDDSIPDFMRGL